MIHSYSQLRFVVIQSLYLFATLRQTKLAILECMSETGIGIRYPVATRGQVLVSGFNQNVGKN